MVVYVTILMVFNLFYQEESMNPIIFHWFDDVQWLSTRMLLLHLTVKESNN